MLDLEKVQRENFEQCHGDTFRLIASDGILLLKLVEVAPLGGRAPQATREPFALRFTFNAPIRVPQAVYRLEHDRLGTLEIFLVQVAGVPQTPCLEAIFT